MAKLIKIFSDYGETIKKNLTSYPLYTCDANGVVSVLYTLLCSEAGYPCTQKRRS